MNFVIIVNSGATRDSGGSRNETTPQFCVFLIGAGHAESISLDQATYVSFLVRCVVVYSIFGTGLQDFECSPVYYHIR